MSNEQGTPIFEVWEKYENIAMHFNDLLIRLRTQAIGGVAAIASIVAVISHNGDNATFNWAIMAGVFFFLTVFWLAIWILDFKYYNPLLTGAVEALLEIEQLSKSNTHISELKLSHSVESAVAGNSGNVDKELQKKISFGRWWFYITAFLGLIAGLLFSLFRYICQ